VIPALAGIFVGGNGTRMGGIAKGLLRTADGPTLVERSRTILERVGAKVVLVGAHDAYARLGLDVIADEPPGIGPLGGLVALLRRAGATPAVAVACDMPFVTSALVERLLATSPNAPIVAPHRDGRWEPLCARYDGATVLAQALALSRSGHHSLQRLLRDLDAVALPLTPEELDELRDWDTPDDVARGGTRVGRHPCWP
jgi:molybdenum cofactor guanylyltransferase